MNTDRQPCSFTSVSSPVTKKDLDAVGAHIILMCAAGASKEGWRIPSDERKIRALIRNPPQEIWTRIRGQLLEGAWKLSRDGRWWEQDGLRRSFNKQKLFYAEQTRKSALGVEARRKKIQAQHAGDPVVDPWVNPRLTPASAFASASESANLNTSPLPPSGGNSKTRRLTRSQIETNVGSGPDLGPPRYCAICGRTASWHRRPAARLFAEAPSFDGHNFKDEPDASARL